jgi:hypothetical protein
LEHLEAAAAALFSANEKDLLFIVSFNKLFDGKAGLSDSAAQCSCGKFFMARYNTALVLPAHYNMTAFLAGLVKPKPDKHLDGFIS